MAKGYTELPVEVSVAPLDRVRCAVKIDGTLRLIPLNRKPTNTPSTRATETVNFALADLPVPGATTLGNVQLIYGLQAGTDYDDWFREKARNSGEVELDFRILGSELFKTAAGTVAISAAKTTGHQAGLSEVTFAAGTDKKVPVIGRDVRRGSVIEMAVGPGAGPFPKSADLAVISHVYYKDGTTGELSTVNRGDGTGGVIGDAKLFCKPPDAAVNAIANYAIRDQSIKWTYTGVMSSYNDQFDEQLGLVAIEVAQEKAVADRELIRSDDVEAAQLYYAA